MLLSFLSDQTTIEVPMESIYSQSITSVPGVSSSRGPNAKPMASLRQSEGRILHARNGVSALDTVHIAQHRQYLNGKHSDS